MNTVTISGREYLMVQTTSKASNCYGCALDGGKTEHGCAYVVEQLPRADRCHNNIIYILNTPEDIAAYAAERLK
jgi:hypothetical protein